MPSASPFPTAVVALRNPATPQGAVSAHVLADLQHRFADVTYKLGYLCGVLGVEPDLPLPAFRSQVRAQLVHLPPGPACLPFPPATPPLAPRHETTADA